MAVFSQALIFKRGRVWLFQCALWLGIFAVNFSQATHFSRFACQNITPPLQWYSWQDAYSTALAQKKIILLHVYTDWCFWCKKMEKETFESPIITTFLDSFFVTTKLNPEVANKYVYKNKEYTARELFFKLADDQAGTYPTLIIIIPSENAYFDKVYTLVGYFSAKELLALLKDIKKRNP
ncbi:MAG: DUF255 domain-containing protein [Bacteroidia bacterium]|nr:DUF255 domain-containing protein [Bacteroidia bacterium]MDW8159746.1 DUF255 domain-containing protein [Bacteroidia bacterium]